jgi:hypothetical protein
MQAILEMLERILSLLGNVLSLLSLLPDQHQADTTLEAIHNVFFEVTDSTYGLAALKAELDDIKGTIGGSGGGVDGIVQAVWGKHWRGSLLAMGDHQLYAGRLGAYLAADGYIPYGLNPYIAVIGDNLDEEEDFMPDDPPLLLASLMHPGDSLLDWLQRCAPEHTWRRNLSSGERYLADSLDAVGQHWLCLLSPEAFTTARDGNTQHGPWTATLLASGITGDHTYTGSYPAYRVDVTAIPSWAGFRVAVPPLYEVNSRMHQLGWAMFGDDDSWEAWQLLVWQQQLCTTRIAVPARFHLFLAAGVVADLYGLSPA